MEFLFKQDSMIYSFKTIEYSVLNLFSFSKMYLPSVWVHTIFTSLLPLRIQMPKLSPFISQPSFSSNNVSRSFLSCLEIDHEIGCPISFIVSWSQSKLGWCMKPRGCLLRCHLSWDQSGQDQCSCNGLYIFQLQWQWGEHLLIKVLHPFYLESESWSKLLLKHKGLQHTRFEVHTHYVCLYMLVWAFRYIYIVLAYFKT